MKSCNVSHKVVETVSADVGESLQKAINQAHGGEIFLLHGVSTTDTKMLGDLIDGLRAKGFKFGYYAKTN